MSYLELNNLSKNFDSVKALDHFSFSVEQNEFAVLFGSSAAGKTTTLRCIAGLEKIDDGEIIFDGTNYTSAPIQGRGIAMIFQTFALYPHLTVAENLSYPLKRLGFEKSDIQSRVDKTAEMLKISHTLQRKPDTLSGGEKQRLAIGRALIQEPKLLLLDEPLANLDAKLRHDTRAELKRLQRDLNMTMVYATPDQLEALTMGDNITIIKEGKFIQKGAPNELYDKPDNSYVAKMIGSPTINFIDAKLTQNNNQNAIELPFGKINLKNSLSSTNDFLNTDLSFGIRPHDITIASDNSNDNFEANVFLKEPLGDVTILDIAIKNNKLKMILPEEEAIKYDVGKNMKVTIDASKAYLFTSDTGVNININ